MEYDAILVGGALVGKALALVLQSLGFRVAIIEATPEGIPTKKLFALHLGSLQFLEPWVSSRFFEQQGAIIQGVCVSQRGHMGTLKLLASEADLPLLGRVISSEALESELMNAIRVHDIPYFSSTRVEHFVELENKIEIQIQQNQSEHVQLLKTKWIFACDGAHSHIRNLAGIETTQKNTQEMALVFKSQWELSHANIAHERKISDSVLALLPLSQNWCASIWSGNIEKMQALMQLKDEDFKKTLEKSFGRRLGSCLSVEWTGHYPLQWVCAKQRQKGRVILMGNAAHTIFPIAAQGFNMALEEMNLLKKIVLSSSEKDEQMMQAISNALSQFQKTGLQWSNGLAEIFRSNFSGSGFLFQCGLTLLNTIKPVKHYALNQLMGRSRRS